MLATRSLLLNNDFVCISVTLVRIGLVLLMCLSLGARAEPLIGGATQEATDPSTQAFKNVSALSDQSEASSESVRSGSAPDAQPGKRPAPPNTVTNDVSPVGAPMPPEATTQEGVRP